MIYIPLGRLLWGHRSHILSSRIRGFLRTWKSMVAEIYLSCQYAAYSINMCAFVLVSCVALLASRLLFGYVLSIKQPWTLHLFAPDIIFSWWRHQMETFSALLAICAENSPVPGEFPAQRPVTRSFDVFFDPRPNKRLSKQSWGWWSETPSSSLLRHRNVMAKN